MDKKVLEKIKRLRNNRDVNGLITILKEGDYEARSYAAETLGALKALQAVPALKLALEDPVRMVVAAAAKSLEMLSVDSDTRQKIEQRLAELDRLEKNHQNRLQEVVASRGDPDVAEAKRIHEILSLADARRQRIQQNEKTNQTWLLVASILGLVALAGWIVKFIFG